MNICLQIPLFRLILLLAVSMVTTFTTAQTGVICGTVTDARDKEPLIGAAVVIAGTTTGSVTDLDGYFRIEGVKPGNHTIQVSYVSYQTETITDVPVVARQEAVLRIELSDATMELQGVVVVAHRKLGTEMAVLNTVRKSLPVVSGISAQQISRTQDNDAAEVLRRIPGITIIDDRFAVVRGLAQRYNNVWLNNASTPSTETDSRAFSFDMIPSSLIDNMMIYKSPSAELPADFAGGFVKILTKNIPDGNTMSIGYQIGFNTNATFKEFQLSERSGSDWLGFGASSRQLPSNAPANMSDISTDEALTFAKRINNRWGINTFKAIPEQKFNWTMTRVFDLGKLQIGNVSGFTYTNSYDYNESVNNNYIAYDMSNDESRYRYNYNDVQYKNTVKLGALFNWSFLVGDHKIELRNFFNQRGTSSLSQREGTDYYSDEYIRKWESLYTSRMTYSGQLGGEHTFRPDISRLEWTAGYGYANYKEPDRRVVKSNLYEVDGESNFMVTEPRRYYEDLKDHTFSLSAGYEHTIPVSDLFTPVISVGGYLESRSRDFDARNFHYSLIGRDYSRYADWDYSGLFADENIASDRISLREITNKSDAYNSDNMTGAGYIATRLNWGEHLRANLGVRMEYYKLNLDGYQTDGVKEVNVRQKDTDFFPSVNVAWNFDEKQQLRAAYGRTTNRAELREIVPYVHYDFHIEANVSGNPDLRNAYINNADLRYEFYPTPGEILSAGLFYKHFSDPIEQAFNETGSGLQYTYRNANSARSYGIEVDAKKNLAFIGVKRLNLVFNGAWIHNKVYFDEGLRERDRPMYDQSPYMINAGLFYQTEDAGTTWSVLYNRIGKRIQTVGIPAQNPNEDIPDIYEMPRNSLDLSFSHKIGKNVEFKAGIKDLLNTKTEYKQFLDITDDDGSTRQVEQLIRSYRSGVKINAAVTIRF